MYNKSQIMKNAWNIRRKSKVSMSIALCKAWAIAKSVSKKAKFDGEANVDGFQFTLWEKYGKRRIYINNYSGRNSKNSGGYIDLNNDNYIVAAGSVKFAAQRFLDEYNIF